jgi:hypothetical protein
MRQSKWAPSISPHDTDQSVYLVLDDFGNTAAPRDGAGPIPGRER